MIRRLLLVAALALMVTAGMALTAPTAHAQTYVAHTVQQGETLAKIARQYCTTWQEIYRINQQVIGPDPSQLEKGMVLSVPDSCSNGGSGSGSNVYDRGPRTYASGTFNAPYYYVAWGDTLTSIAGRFGVSVDAIMRANNLSSSNITAGQALIIPGTGTPPPPTDAERVQFAYGAVSATRSGSLNTGEIKRYVLEASAGQTMQVYVSNSGPPMPINVTGPGNQPVAAPLSTTSGQSSIQQYLSTSGDYVVAIGPANQPTSYTVTFVIQ